MYSDLFYKGSEASDAKRKKKVVMHGSKGGG